ncbi:hypothetical protein LTR95_002367 [Oleoguttula sp. CCFEE 5521]
MDHDVEAVVNAEPTGARSAVANANAYQTWSYCSNTPESGASVMTPSATLTLSAMPSRPCSPLDQAQPVQVQLSDFGDVAAGKQLSLDGREAEPARKQRQLDERKAAMAQDEDEAELERRFVGILPEPGVRIPAALVQAFQDMEQRMADLDAAHEVTFARHDVCAKVLEDDIEALQRQLAGVQQHLNLERAGRDGEVKRYEEARSAIMLEMTALKAEVAKLLRRD